MMIRTLEEMSMNAQPCLRSLYYDGWIIRFADGYSRRANSVNPIYRSTIGLDKKIGFCEHAYRSIGQKVIFKLTDAVFPENLDAVLKASGYGLDIPVSIQTLDLERIEEPIDCGIAVTDEPSQDWEKWFAEMSNAGERHKITIGAMLKRIVPKKGFFTIVREGWIAACGLGVIQSDYVGLFDIMTDPGRRRQGLGRQISLSILKWGKENGARTAYLQVMTNNKPALRLYENLGFGEVYKYWYRIKE